MDLTQCNDLLRRELGETPSGHAKFIWIRASHLDLFGRKPGFETQETGGLVSLAIPRWAKRDWSDLLGDVWVIAMWHAPMPRWQWDATIGPAFPYPSCGSYVPVSGATLPVGDEPDRARTEYAIGRLKIDLAKTFKDRKEELEVVLDGERKQLEALTEAWVNDTCTAYLAVPGEKGHTAFQVPGLREKEKEVGAKTLGD